MDIVISLPLAIAATFIWIGLILGISFLEAWLKFRAPGVTTAIGLGIGRLVFGALNKLEWLLAMVLAVATVAGNAPLLSGRNVALAFLLGLLILQTLWLLPTLNKRAQAIIDNTPVPRSRLHIVFIAAELVKITLLFIVGIALLTDL